jgi:hypothetical protein
VRLAEEQVEDMPQHKKEAVAGAVQAAIDEDLLDVNEGDVGDDR